MNPFGDSSSGEDAPSPKHARGRRASTNPFDDSNSDSDSDSAKARKEIPSTSQNRTSSATFTIGSDESISGRERRMRRAVSDALRGDETFSPPPVNTSKKSTKTKDKKAIYDASVAGIEGIIVKPIAEKAMLTRVMTTLLKPERIVLNANFAGPDRRELPRIEPENAPPPLGVTKPSSKIAPRPQGKARPQATGVVMKSGGKPAANKAASMPITSISGVAPRPDTSIMPLRIVEVTSPPAK